MERKSYIELSNNGGYFSKFEWQMDEYGRFKEQQIEERKKKKKAQEDVHKNSPFLINPFKPKPLKHHSDFVS